MCVVDDQGFMLQSSQDKLNIYLFDGQHLESHQFINAPRVKVIAILVTWVKVHQM